MKSIKPFGAIVCDSLADLPYDPTCPIERGSRIEKIKEDTPGEELHPIGSKGYTLAGFMKDGIDGYLVIWDNQVDFKVPNTDRTVIAVMGYKIKAIPGKNYFDKKF